MDLFIVNMAFVAISSDFPDSSPQTMSWIINAYSVAFASLLVPAGRLADRYGRKLLFRCGLTVFAVGSLSAALSPDITLLIAARGLQGLGAALFVPTGLALLLASSAASRHTTMIGIWTAVGSVAAAAGPIVGGALTQFHWRWIFLISAPVVLLALVTSVTLKETPRAETKVPDLWGSALLAVGVGALVTALSHVSDWGLTDPRLAGLFAVAAGGILWFARRCVTRPSPAVNLRLFTDPTFAWATFGIASYFVGFAILLLGGSLMLTRVWAMDPILAGVVFSLGPLTAMTTATFVGRSGLSPRALAGIGSALNAAAGLLWCGFLESDSSLFPVFFAGLLISGVGAGAGQVGFMAAGASSLTAAEYGAGTGVINTARQIGSAMGVAVLVAIVGVSAVAEDFRGAWLALVFASVVAGAASLLFRTAPAEPSKTASALR